jgi:hypothetical protein
MITEAHNRLDAAQASLKSIERRADLITRFVCGTWDYKTAEKDADYYSILVLWMLEQLPLVEAELKAFMAAEGESNMERSTKRRLSYCQNDDLSSDRGSKPQRGSDQSLVSKSRAESNMQVIKRSKRRRHGDTIDGGQRPARRFRDGTQDSKSLHRASDDTSGMPVGGYQQSGIPAAREQDGGDDKAVLKHIEVPRTRRLRSDILRPSITSQQLRRSPRIAARQDPFRIVTWPLHSVKSSSLRSRRKIERVATPKGTRTHLSPYSQRPKT